MSFSTESADLIAAQLSRFLTLKRHQLAGQVANLDFWLGEVRHALGVIDGYGIRFIKMEAAQEQYVAGLGITEQNYGPAGPHVHEPSAPRRIADRELQKSRRALIDSASRFIERCHREGLILESQMSPWFEVLGTEGDRA